jgi:hypothetical protein
MRHQRLPSLPCPDATNDSTRQLAILALAARARPAITEPTRPYASATCLACLDGPQHTKRQLNAPYRPEQDRLT